MRCEGGHGDGLRRHLRLVELPLLPRQAARHVEEGLSSSKHDIAYCLFSLQEKIHLLDIKSMVQKDKYIKIEWIDMVTAKLVRLDGFFRSGIRGMNV